MTKSLEYLCYLIPVIYIIALFVRRNKSTKENFINTKHNKKCPNILIKEGKHLVLYNSRLAKIPGINPVLFNNLEDYVEYVKWQQSQKIHCPVLFLQRSFDAQGNSIYRHHPSPLEMEGGLPPISGLEISERTTINSPLIDAGRNDPPYNKKSYPGFDPHNQYVGLNTVLDTIEKIDIEGKSPSPMDTNWAGQGFTQDLIDQGYYDEMKVYVPVARET